MSDFKTPSPDELQQNLTSFMSTQFDDETRDDDAEPEVFRFSHLPRDIKAHLDRFVIQQDEAKKVLAIAVCDHYNHIRHLRALAAQSPEEARQLEYVKQNVFSSGRPAWGKPIS
jgi:ATP-dependent protease Clp ATPase subunit